MIVHVHASLYHGAPSAAVVRYLLALIDAHGAHLLTTTETKRATTRLLRKRLGPGWRVTRRREYIIAWRRDTLRGDPRRRPRLRRLSHVYRGRDRWRDLYVYTRHLVLISTGRRIATDVGHLAAGVEMGDAWRGGESNPQVRAHKAGTAQWCRIVARRRRRWPDGRQILAMDANTDQRRDAWRARLTVSLALPSVWRGRVPDEGTHGHRLIDTIHTDLRVTRAEVSHIRPPALVDHRAIITHLEDA